MCPAVQDALQQILGVMDDVILQRRQQGLDQLVGKQQAK